LALTVAASAPGQVGSEVAYAALRTAIIEGEFRPGERIIEQRLAANLGLSRTPVREAVRMLAADGLVIATRHRGAIVRPLERADVLDLYELRARLESYAAELASSRAQVADLAEMNLNLVVKPKRRPVHRRMTPKSGSGLFPAGSPKLLPTEDY
jgi:DNA-binding GntR family transcriptional regulator